ncbi:MAG TPA: hypothetical protein VMT11_17805 [Myxococcaceae bacterium]|nr:hypothetical protein [Myxococcaceae bacterium]
MDVPVQALSPRACSLAPGEHGAYGQLAVPTAAALAGGRPGPGALLLAASAWALLDFAALAPLVLTSAWLGLGGMLVTGAVLVLAVRVGA